MSLAQAHEHALVVLAMGEECWVREDPGDGAGGPGFTLLAEPAPAARATAELAAYDDEESRRRSEPAPALPHFPSGYWLALLWMVALMAVFLWQLRDPALTGRACSSSLGLINGHEWWRPFTSLFLHADLHHLLGNLFTGVLFAVFLSRSVGPATGWLLLLAGGTLGNTLSSLTAYPRAFTSLGASTAVFAALGALTGVGFVASLRLPSGHTWARVLLPVIGGILLLGWMGGGGEQTDVLGHAYGFAAGGTVGLAAGWWRLRGL